MKFKSQEARPSAYPAAGTKAPPRSDPRLGDIKPAASAQRGAPADGMTSAPKKQLPSVRNIHPDSITDAGTATRRLSEGSSRVDPYHSDGRWTTMTTDERGDVKNVRDQQPDKWSERVLPSRDVRRHPGAVTSGVVPSDVMSKVAYVQRSRHQIPTVRSLSSASESSLDDHHHYRDYREDSDGWRRRRSRVSHLFSFPSFTRAGIMQSPLEI